jgi:peroxiredoxin
MKKLALFLALITMTIACNKAGSNEYIITGAIKDIPDGKMVYLESEDENGQWKAMDTTTIEKGIFTFKGSASEPMMYLIQVETVNGKIPFILENGDIDVNIDKDSLMNSKITGTYNNDEFMKIREEQKAFEKKVKKFEMDNSPLMQKAQEQGDTTTINRLRKEWEGFSEELYKRNEKYVANNPKSFLSALILQDMFRTPEMKVEDGEKYYNKFDESIKNTKTGKKIKELLDMLKKTAIGGTAPSFSAPSPEGKQISLEESMGKVTIIDFWASWCKPCRAENPNVVALYNEFHSKGLNIIGVSLDKDAAAWKEAIAADKLTWTQVSNLDPNTDPIVKDYNITSIPATFIIDQNGKIIAKDLRGDELRAKIASLLGS